MVTSSNASIFSSIISGLLFSATAPTFTLDTEWGFYALIFSATAPTLSVERPEIRLLTRPPPATVKKWNAAFINKKQKERSGGLGFFFTSERTWTLKYLTFILIVFFFLRRMLQWVIDPTFIKKKLCRYISHICKTMDRRCISEIISKKNLNGSID